MVPASNQLLKVASIPLPSPAFQGPERSSGGGMKGLYNMYVYKLPIPRIQQVFGLQLTPPKRPKPIPISGSPTQESRNTSLLIFVLMMMITNTWFRESQKTVAGIRACVQASKSSNFTFSPPNFPARQARPGNVRCQKQ